MQPNDNKIEKLLNFADDPELAIFDELQEINDNLAEVKDLNLADISVLQGEDGHTPTEDELLSLIKPLIPEPIKGKDGGIGARGLKGDRGDSGLDGIDGERGNKIVMVNNLSDAPKDAIIGDILVIENTSDIYIYE